MSQRQSLSAMARDAIRNIMGVSAYEKPHGYGLDLDDETVEQIREALGGQLQPQVDTRLRWYIAELEQAQFQADAGTLLMAAQIYRAFRRDGTLSGLLGTRGGGLVRLPKNFYGDPEIADDLRAKNGTRSVFDEMFPPSELKLLAIDGFVLGVGIAELVPVADRDYPVLVRLDPENLQYRWNENRWYYKSTAGLLPVTPGDGRWVLHTPGARLAPWNSGLWPALGESWINKSHAKFHRSNYSMKLANPARVATSPLGSSEEQKRGWFKKVGAWAINTVFDAPAGWDVKIIESNGRGIDVFQKEIDTSDLEFTVAVNGQLVTMTGGAGFQNADIFARIRGDIIRDDGDSLAYTINTQGIPLFIATRYGAEAITSRTTIVDWETATPKEMEAEARTLGLVAAAITSLAQALQGSERQLDLEALLDKFGVPVRDPANTNAGTGLLVLGKDTANVGKALASLTALLPASAKRLSLERLEQLHRRAA